MPKRTPHTELQPPRIYRTVNDNPDISYFLDSLTPYIESGVFEWKKDPLEFDVLRLAETRLISGLGAVAINDFFELAPVGLRETAPFEIPVYINGVRAVGGKPTKKRLLLDVVANQKLLEEYSRARSIVELMSRRHLPDPTPDRAIVAARFTPIKDTTEIIEALRPSIPHKVVLGPLRIESSEI